MSPETEVKHLPKDETVYKIVDDRAHNSKAKKHSTLKQIKVAQVDEGSNIQDD